jgi:hypothetical protein
MKGSFVETRLADVPPWIAGHDGAAVQTALGHDQDAHVKSLEDAAKMASPFLCADDALDAVGRRFSIPRLPGEPNGTAPVGGLGGTGGTGYRGRLCAAWSTWQFAGTATGVINAIQAYGIPDVVVLPVYQSPAPIAPESSSTSYSEFYVKLGPNFGTTGIAALILGSWILGSALLGSTMTANQLADLKRLILRWKATHGLPIKLLLDFGSGWTSGATWYPIGRTLGDTWPALGDAGCILGGYFP